MTVREFIDRIVAQARKGWRHLTPVYEEWGDGVFTACAVTAIASEEEHYVDFLGDLDESHFVPWAERQIATVAIDGGMSPAYSYDFAHKIVEQIPNVYDNDLDCDWKSYGDFDFSQVHVGLIGRAIGHELRRVAQCVLSERNCSQKSASKDVASAADDTDQLPPITCSHAEQDELIAAGT